MIHIHVTANLPRGEGHIQLTLPLRLCDPVVPLGLILRTSVRKENLFSYFTSIIMIKKIGGFNLKRILL